MIPGSQSDILAIHPGALGDLVLFGQFVQALRDRGLPRVRLVAGRAKCELLQGLGVADEAVDFEALAMDEVFRDDCPPPGRLAGQLGRCRLLVSCFVADDVPARQRLAGCTHAESALFVPIRPPADFPSHLVNFWAGLAGLAEVPLPAWQAPGAWQIQAAQTLRPLGLRCGHYAIIQPGSGSRTKCWPLERFLELARALEQDVLFVLGPVEQEWWGPEVTARIARDFRVVSSPPLSTLCGLLAGASVFVGNDSGPAHLSAALSRPTVSIFGPTDPTHFAPRGVLAQAIAADNLAQLEVSRVLAASKAF